MAETTPDDLTTEEATGETPFTLLQAECDGLKIRNTRLEADKRYLLDVIDCARKHMESFFLIARKAMENRTP